MNALNELEIIEWEEQPEESKQRFQICDLDSLNWAFRKLSAYKAKEKEISDLAAKERARIDMWEAEEKKKIQDSINFFESLIHEYHAKVLAENPRTKTISTPYGKSKARTSRPQPKKVDEATILKHVLENNMKDYIKPTLKWADLKKNLQIAEIGGRLIAVDENGQEVPGVVIEPEQTKFTVEVELDG